MAPFASIVTVCLNSEATIHRCLRSLLNQSYGKFEVIIVDGKSSDRTLEIVATCAEQLELRGVSVTLKSEPDRGIYDAINKGICLCTGTVIGILNSDDFYEPRALEQVCAKFTENDGAEIVYGLLRQWKNGQELGVHRYNYDYILSSLESGIESAAQHPACFIRKSVYDRIDLYDTSYPIAADYEFLLRAKRLGVSFTAIDTVVTNFTLGGASSLMTDGDRLEQRFRAQHANGLLTDAEYRKKQRLVARARFGEWRTHIMHRFGRLLRFDP